MQTEKNNKRNIRMKIIDRLTADVLSDDYFKSLYLKLSIISAKNILSIDSDCLTSKELKDLLKFSDILSNSSNSDARNRAYQIITFLNRDYFDSPVYQVISKAVYSKLGNFPAINYLEKINNNQAELPITRFIELEAKSILQEVPDSENLVFTDNQYELFNKISNTLEFSFSAPTSMGKSFIIKAFIKKVLKNKPPENLVVIVPTKALINQFALDLKNELRESLMLNKYIVLTNSNITNLIYEDTYHYIFVLTPERLISYLSQSSNPPVGFIFVDEAHKLANNKDSRSITTYVAIEQTIKKYGNIKLYFSSPNVSNPDIFLKIFNRNQSNIYRTTESPVSQNIFFIDLANKNVELIQDIAYSIDTESFFENIYSIEDLIVKLGLNSNNLIYCNSKQTTIANSYKLSKKLPKNELSENLKTAIEHIKEYVHPQYYLAELLEYKVAFHYGKLPQLIRNIIENLYKNGEVNSIFCTSTLLEGVNMPTQNLFVLNSKNGNRKLEPIDFWNLSGRAGRLAKELYGNIFCVRYQDKDWENKDNVLYNKDITLTPTVFDKINKNLKK
jgi:replicative superfamily II helicase